MEGQQDVQRVIDHVKHVSKVMSKNRAYIIYNVM